MDRLWSVLVLGVVLCLGAADARDKAKMPGAMREEGRPSNATAMRTVVPEPTAGGRVDPKVIAGVYNMSVPIDTEPQTYLDGATLAKLSRKVVLAANGTVQAYINGTLAKGEHATGSSGGNATMSLDASASAQKGALPNATNANLAFDDSTSAQKGAVPKTANATMVLDRDVHGQKRAMPKATNVTTSKGDEAAASAAFDDGHRGKAGPMHEAAGGEPARRLTNGTATRFGPLPNVTRAANGTLAWARNLTGRHSDGANGSFSWAGNLTAHRTNDHASADGSVVHLTKGAKGQVGSLANETSSAATVGLDKPDYAPTPTTPTTPMPAKQDWAPRDPTLKAEPQPADAYGGVTLWTRYRLAPGEEPQASANRSDDPDVVAMKEIASAVLDGPEKLVAIMTTGVIRSVLPNGEDGTMMRDNELHEAIRGKFKDEDLMRRILEGDANEAPAIPEQGPCEACPQPASVVCSLCSPADFCRPFASKVDIPCPAESF